MENFSNDGEFNQENFSKPNNFKKIIIFCLIGLFVFLFSGYYLFLSPPTNFPSGSILSIQRGDSLREVSLSLKKDHFIRSRIAFEAFVIIFGGEKHLNQGDYLFEKKLKVYEIADRIVQKDRRLASLKVTIPEGFDISQITELFSAKLKNFDKNKFLAKAKEGYLFPDTYFFLTSDSEQEVLKSFSENFERKIKSMSSEILASGKSENEIIIMASLIEREAKGDTDRGYISGILWNRLKKGMPLQVDAALETYKTRGLPKSPICNPGLEAIRAAIDPTHSSFLYYLHDKDGNIHYAKTFEEHKVNKLKYLK